MRVRITYDLKYYINKEILFKLYYKLKILPKLVNKYNTKILIIQTPPTHLPPSGLQTIYTLEDLPYRSRNHAHVLLFREEIHDSARALHGVRLSRARLSIREDADVVSVHGGLNQLGDLIKDLSLGGGRGEDRVEREVVLLLGFAVLEGGKCVVNGMGYNTLLPKDKFPNSKGLVL